MAQAVAATTGGEAAARALYAALLESWNRRDSSQFATLYASDARLVGFDGSDVRGADISGHLDPLFADHPTASYVARIAPGLNVVQSLIAVDRRGSWQIALYQNTPAQHHRGTRTGRPAHRRTATDPRRPSLVPLCSPDRPR